MPADRPIPVVLRGEWVRLEPLGIEHVPALTAATAGDDQVWEWMPAFPADEAGMSGVVERALADRDQGTRFPFAVVDSATGHAIGSSSYLDIDPANERIEIGWTWLARSAWRSPVNTEAKILLLGHAFDTLGYERVALKTHHLNVRSQAAIARLGAVPEGTLRHHIRHRDGTRRDTVYFSVLSSEWPSVRENLTARLRG
jgi:N-acetyltransferase